MERTKGTVLIGLVDAGPRVTLHLDAEAFGLSKNYAVNELGVEMTPADAKLALQLSGTRPAHRRVMVNLDVDADAEDPKAVKLAQAEAAEAAKIAADEHAKAEVESAKLHAEASAARIEAAKAAAQAHPTTNDPRRTS